MKALEILKSFDDYHYAYRRELENAIVELENVIEWQKFTCNTCKFLRTEYNKNICTRTEFSFNGGGVNGFIGILENEFCCNKYKKKGRK